MDQRSNCTMEKFLSSRQATFDVGYLGLRKHHMKVLLELDVTDARALIKKYRRQTKEALSFTAWMLKCISQGISEHKAVHAIRKGRNKRVIFDDIDMAIVIEKEVKGEKVPLPLVIRNVNEKSLTDIHDEISSARSCKVIDEKGYVLGENRYQWAMKLYVSLPQVLRILIWKQFILKNPFLMKQMSGTVVVTSVGMMGNVKGWPIPVSLHPICFALGSIVKKPGVYQKQIAIREYLYMTVLIDHDVVDGAPAARFISRLTDLIEGGYGL